MKKSIIVSIMIICIVLFSMNIVNAATNSVSLTASSKTVKPGETFTVTLSAKCEDGINGIDTTYSYDKNKLEIVNANVSSNNWASMGVNETIQVICNSTSKVTSDNIYVLTFKVKDNIEAGDTSISTTEIKVDSDLSTSSFTDGAKSVNINIVSVNSNTSNDNNDNNDNNENNKDNGNNNTQNITTSNNNNSVSEETNNKKDNNSISNVNKAESQDETTIKNKILPKTGANSYVRIIFVFGTVIVIGGYCLIRIKLINKK